MPHKYLAVWKKSKNALIWFLPAALATGSMGAYFGTAVLTKDLDWDAQSSALMPFPLMLPMLVVNWYFERDVGQVDPWSYPSLARWWIFGSALSAAYLSSFLPDALLEATVLTSIISVIVWLVSVQSTRKLLRERARTSVARRCRLDITDPKVEILVTNNDLPNAIVVSTFVSVEVWLLVSGDAFAMWTMSLWEHAGILSTGGARSLAFGAGLALGLNYFRYCPNQTAIRELASQARLRTDEST